LRHVCRYGMESYQSRAFRDCQLRKRTQKSNFDKLSTLYIGKLKNYGLPYLPTGTLTPVVLVCWEAGKYSYKSLPTWVLFIPNSGNLKCIFFTLPLESPPTQCNRTPDVEGDTEGLRQSRTSEFSLRETLMRSEVASNTFGGLSRDGGSG